MHFTKCWCKGQTCVIPPFWTLTLSEMTHFSHKCYDDHCFTDWFDCNKYSPDLHTGLHAFISQNTTENPCKISPIKSRELLTVEWQWLGQFWSFVLPDIGWNHSLNQNVLQRTSQWFTVRFHLCSHSSQSAATGQTSIHLSTKPLCC